LGADSSKAAKAAGPAFQTTGTLLQVMRGIMLPNANVVFDSGNAPPKDDKGWLAALAKNADALLDAAGRSDRRLRRVS
jgi:hypothetical protein